MTKIMHFENITQLIIIYSFYDNIYQYYRTQQNNFNYLIILNFHYEILYFFIFIHNCKNLLLHDLHLNSYQLYLALVQQNLDIFYEILMLMYIFYSMHKLILKNMINVLIFIYLNYLNLFLLALIIILYLNFCKFYNLMELMEHSWCLGMLFVGLLKLGNLGVRLRYDYHRNC